MKTNVKKMMVLAIATLALTACSKDSLFDESAIEQQTKATYAENFVNKYPNVDLNQSWDFSHKQPSYTLNTSNKVRTRAGEGSWSKESWYDVDNNTLDWMHDKLEEGKDHRNLGNPFYMTVPGNDFYIVPIYQGVASAVWEFHVVIGSNDYLIWGKSEEIEIKDVRNQEWHSVVQPTYEWGGDGAWWESLFNTDGNDKWTWIPSEGGVRNTVTNVRAIPRKFSNFPVGEEMYFYLKVIKGDPDRCNDGAEQSSLNGQILALDCPRPANIPENYETMIIGCEDANLTLSDHDMNDVVFLVYGERVPKPIEITEGDPVVNENRIVRYMIEDLGATDDFDFNDIVIDMVEQTPKTPVYTNGVLTDWRYGTTSQKAVIRHLGGTLPFILKIGDTEYAAGGSSTFQTNPDIAFDVTGWDINRHNISIQVQQLGSGGQVYNNIQFPRAGEAPMVIAVDPSQQWMPERQSVPESWFYTPDPAQE